MKYLLCLLAVAWVDYPQDNIELTQWTKAREVDYGYGPIVDDVESYVLDDQYAKSMRNPKDPGNWVHEMTHLINANCRMALNKKYGKEYNAAYVLNGYAFCAPEPNITLAQVAAEVPLDQRRGDYEHYMVYAQRYRNKQPLFVLDEASAAANGLCYQVDANKKDKHRAGLVLEWIDYSTALVKAVEKHDPNYSHLDKLKAFVAWHNKRGGFLYKKHEGEEPIVYRLK